MVDSIVQFASGLAADWASVNPIIQQGVPAWETDTHQGKVGDGFSHYNDLPYSLSGNSDSSLVIDDTTSSSGGLWSSQQTASADASVLQQANAYADSLAGAANYVVTPQASNGAWPSRPQATAVLAIGYPGRTDLPTWLLFQVDSYRYLSA